MDAKSLQFKPVFSAMIEKGGNWGAVAGTHKRPFKTVVREVWPALLLTDGEVFVPASFTQEALDEFRKKYGKVHVTDLKDKHIVVNKWALQMSRVDSEKVWHSYGGVEVSLVVQSFAPKANEKKATISFVPNIFREQDIKDTINQHWHARISESLDKNAADLVSVKKVSEERKAKGVAPESVHALKKNFEIAPPKGKFALVKQDAIVKSEKGESFLNNLKKPEASGAGGKRRAKEDAKRAAKAAKSSQSEIKSAVKKIIKYGGNDKKGAAPVKGGKSSAQKKDEGKGSAKKMNLTQYKDYLSWYEKRKKEGKLTPAASAKKTPARAATPARSSVPKKKASATKGAPTPKRTKA